MEGDRAPGEPAEERLGLFKEWLGAGRQIPFDGDGRVNDEGVGNPSPPAPV